MAKNENRNYVTLKCTVCGEELRCTSKSKKNTPERLEVKKYCKKCHKHQIVKEKKNTPDRLEVKKYCKNCHKHQIVKEKK